MFVSAALTFGNSKMLIPTKKKGAGPLFQIHHGNKWGFMDRTGKVVIPPRFDGVSDFFDGLAKVSFLVEKTFKFCFIDERGKIVIPCDFEVVGDFSEGLAPVRIGIRAWGYIDRFRARPWFLLDSKTLAHSKTAWRGCRYGIEFSAFGKGT